MKSLFFTVLTILAVLAPLANAQGVYISPWESGSAQYRAFRLADTLATCGGYCTPSPANPFGGFPGVRYPGGVNGDRVARDASAAAAGAGFGYAIAGRKGAIGLGLAGLGLAELGDHLANRRDQPLDCGKRKLSRDEREACAELRQQAEAEHQAAAAQAAAEERAMLSTRWLFNRSGQRAFVKDSGQPICLNPGKPGERCFMNPAENWPVDQPANEYTVVLNVPKGAGIVNIPGEVRSLGDQGWEIIAPKMEAR